MRIVNVLILILVGISLPFAALALPGKDFRDCSDPEKCIQAYGDFNWPLCGRVMQNDPNWVEGTDCPATRWGLVDRYVDPDPETPDGFEDFIAYGFGPRNFQGSTRAVDWHRGIDLEAETGTDVFATMCGEVREVSSGANGIEVIIRHWRRNDLPEGLCNNTDGAAPGLGCNEMTPCIYTRYHHLSATSVTVGEWVVQGQKIADTGTSEQGDKHLHFELRVPGLIDEDDSGRRMAKDAINPLWALPFDVNEAAAALVMTPASVFPGSNSFEYEYVVAADREAFFHNLKEVRVKVWIDGVLQEGREDSPAEFAAAPYSSIAIPHQNRVYQRFNPDTYNITWTPFPTDNERFNPENQIYSRAPINDGFDTSNNSKQKLNMQYVDRQGMTHHDTFGYRNWNVRPSRDVVSEVDPPDPIPNWEWRIRKSVPASLNRACVLAFADYIGVGVVPLGRLGNGCNGVPTEELASDYRHQPHAVITSAACCGYAGKYLGVDPISGAIRLFDTYNHHQTRWLEEWDGHVLRLQSVAPNSQQHWYLDISTTSGTFKLWPTKSHTGTKWSLEPYAEAGGPIVRIASESSGSYNGQYIDISTTSGTFKMWPNASHTGTKWRFERP